MSRFDYVKYDAKAQALQEFIKKEVQEFESVIIGIGLDSIGQSENGKTVASLMRAKALALTALEEMYMWAGKAIRDEQILRNGSAPLEESRTNS